MYFEASACGWVGELRLHHCTPRALNQCATCWPEVGLSRRHLAFRPCSSAPPHHVHDLVHDGQARGGVRGGLGHRLHHKHHLEGGKREGRTH